MNAGGERVDVLVVGGGLMGAAVARSLRDADPGLGVLVADGGPVIGSVPGQHLHDVPEPEIWQRYNTRVASGIQGFYTGTPPTTDVGSTLSGVEPGMYHLSSLGEDSAAMPAASLAWNAGGMGVHWTAATPEPWGDEVPEFLPDDEWRDDLDRARELLQVTPEPFPPTEAGRAATAVIADLFAEVDAPGRNLRPMPMAAHRDPSGVLRRTGPNVIFPAIADDRRDPRFTLRSGTRAVRLEHSGGEVQGAWLQDIDTGRSRLVRAGATVVCADAMRSPQLLFASGIRPPALGHYLNEHAFLTGRVLTDPDRLGYDLARVPLTEDGETMVEHYWLPHSGESQPFQFQLGNQVFVDDDSRRLAYAIGLGVYVATEIRAENRLEFGDTATDASGMPRISVRFSWSERDHEMIDRARQAQRKVAEALGPFDPTTESTLLDPGCSLHFTGTVRMGPLDDGTSVCDPQCRVWGFDNLFVAGNGVLPTALACNATLAGMTTAVRAARCALRATGHGTGAATASGRSVRT